MDLQTILAQWQEDCVIDNSRLDVVSRDTPKLHAKYLEKLSYAKLSLRRAEAAQKILLKNKWLWYNGKMSQERMDELGWSYDPLDGLKIMKGEMDYYYDSDPDIQKSEEKIAYWKTVIDTLTDIVDSLKWRHQTVGNIIRWKTFEAGG
jgi:hypothetical protein